MSPNSYAEEDGRQNAVLGDRRGQILHGLGIHVLPGLVGIGLQIGEGDVIELTLFIPRRCCCVCRYHLVFLLSVFKGGTAPDY